MLTFFDWVQDMSSSRFSSRPTPLSLNPPKAVPGKWLEVSFSPVSRATYYVHFANKFDVLVEIWHNQVDSGILEVFANFNDLGPCPGRQELRDWIGTAVEYWQSVAEITELSERVLALEPGVTAPWMERNERAVDAMAHYQSRFTAEELPLAKMRMSALLLQLDRMCFILNRGENQLGKDLLVEGLTDIWWGVLKP